MIQRLMSLYGEALCRHSAVILKASHVILLAADTKGNILGAFYGNGAGANLQASRQLDAILEDMKARECIEVE